MMNPTMGPPQGPLFPMQDNVNPPPVASSEPLPAKFISVHVDEDEEKEIVRQCNKFIKAAIAHAASKKEIMKTCYAYSKSKLLDGDLLPRLTSVGNKNQNDATGRPSIFIPITRQVIKDLYSKTKLSILPNDDEYMKVVADNQEFQNLEWALTEGLKKKFKDMGVTEKIGLHILNLIIFGSAASFPDMEDTETWEWAFVPGQPASIDPMTGQIIEATGDQYVPTITNEPPAPSLDIFDSLSFYIDPNAKNLDRAMWGCIGQKSVQEIKDNNLYINTDKLDKIETTTTKDHDSRSSARPTGYTDTASYFHGIDKYVKYDLYYFPFLKTKKREYRNMMVGVAGEEVLVRFHPNLFPKGLNPVVFSNWMPDPYSVYGISPIEDIMVIQKIINIIYNYLIETLSRIGNRFVAIGDIDVSNLFGTAGGVATGGQGTSLTAITGDYAEISQLLNFCGIIKQEAQVTAGGANPFQGASNIDFRKTATELQIMQEQSVSVIREVIEHISVTAVKRILEKLMYLIAQMSTTEEEIRIDDEKTGQTQFIQVDFSVLLKGKFRVELTGVNPSQSKSAQVNGLMQLLEISSKVPELAKRLKGYEVGKAIMLLQGIRDSRSMFKTEEEVKQDDMEEQITNNALMMAAQQGDQGSAQLLQEKGMMNGPRQSGISNSKVSLPANKEPGME